MVLDYIIAAVVRSKRKKRIPFQRVAYVIAFTTIDANLHADARSHTHTRTHAIHGARNKKDMSNHDH